MRATQPTGWLSGLSLIIVTTLLLPACAWFPNVQEAPYQLVKTWGEKGTAAGQFNEPTGIVVTSTEIFVSDARNSRIQVFDYNGAFKRQFNLPGKDQGQLSRPMNLTIAADEIFIADYWNDRIQTFSLAGKFLRYIGDSDANMEPGQFNAPAGVAVATNGDIYVADFYNQRIQQLSANGHFIRQWGTTGKTSSRAGQFSYPTDVALATDGSLYVADGYNDRIQVFTKDGQFSHKWGGPLAMNIHGPFNGWFATVTAIAIGPEGNIFVADFYNDRIQKFSAKGRFLTAFGRRGDGTHHTAMAVAVANDGSVFVTDIANHQIHKWSNEGHDK